MASTLRRVQSGWLSRSIEQAREYEKKNPKWVVQVRDNWKQSDAEVAAETIDEKVEA